MRSRSRLVLLWWLGGLLFLIVVTGAAGILSFSRARSAESALQARYLERTAALDRLRSAILRSDALERNSFTQPQLAEWQRQSRLDLDSAGASASLRGEVTSWWKVVELMSGMDRSPRIDAYFRTQMGQRRQTLLHIESEIEATLRADWNSRENEISAVYRRLQWILASGLLVVIVAGAALSFTAVKRLARLESQTRALGARLVSAQEEERRSIARELHDEIGQSLTSLRLDLGAARLDSAARTLERIVEEVRRIALSLRPSMLDDLGLVAALEWQGREVSTRTGVPVEVQADETAGSVPDALRTCIYRVAQEALQNSVKHAGARKIRVGLEKNGCGVRLTIDDDGRGFSPARCRGLGLLWMEERVAQLGGRLRIGAAPGGGTTVSAELPL